MRTWFPNRKYKSGTGWCFWRWTDVSTEYILRLHVLKTPWFAICLHWLNKADPDPYLHDHPVSFLSVILKGGYGEYRQDAPYWHDFYNWISASTRHRIVEIKPGTLTLCFMGPKTQEWGFYVPGRGKVFWKDYYAEKKHEP